MTNRKVAIRGTAVYGPVCPVVWKGGLSPPPPIGYRLLSFEMTQLFITEHSGHRDALRVDHTAVHTSGIHREGEVTLSVENNHTARALDVTDLFDHCVTSLLNIFT